MGFNLGAFAGGAAQAGMSAYKTQQEIALQKAAADREAERLGFERQRAAEAERQVGLAKGAEEQMRNSALPTSGGVPLEDVVNAANPTVSNVERAGGAGAAQTDIPMSGEARQALQTRIAGMSPQEQAKAIQGYGSVTMPNAPNAERAGGAAAAIPLANAVTYKDQNGKTFVSQPITDETTIVANMKQRAYESGNPVAIKQANDMEAQVLQKTQVRQAIQLGSKQLLSADRIERDAQKVEDFQTWHSGMVAKAQQDPMEAAKAMVVEYNTGAQHQDGRTAKIVTGPDAAPLMVFTDDKTGKQIGNALPITPETVQQGIEQMAFQKWKTLPGNFAKGVELQNKEKEIANQGMTAQAAMKKATTDESELAEKIKVGLYGAQAQRDKDTGAAAKQNAQNTADHYAYLRAQANEKSNLDKEARAEVVKITDAFAKLSTADKEGQKGQDLMIQGAMAIARKTGDITSVLTAMKKPDRSGAEADWSAIEKSMYANDKPPDQIAAARGNFYASRGFAPASAVSVVTSGKGPDGKPLTEVDVDNFNRQFPNSKVDKTTLPWLKPAATSAIPVAAAPAAPKSYEMYSKEYLAKRAAQETEDKAKREALLKQIQNKNVNRPQAKYNPATLLAPAP